MKCAIMQPSYFPWAGYFNLIFETDVFVFLDDAQLQKNSWHNRNRILLNGKPHWITVPVVRERTSQTIAQTEIDNSRPWVRKHAMTIRQAYCKHPFADDISDLVSTVEHINAACLATLNMALVRKILSLLEVNTTIVYSSELQIPGKRTDRLIAILEMLRADRYVSPVGASDYLEEDRFQRKTSIILEFQSYQAAHYSQFGSSGFVSHLSILDVIANLGFEQTKSYIQ